MGRVTAGSIIDPRTQADQVQARSNRFQTEIKCPVQIINPGYNEAKTKQGIIYTVIIVCLLYLRKYWKAYIQPHVFGQNQKVQTSTLRYELSNMVPSNSAKITTPENLQTNTISSPQPRPEGIGIRFLQFQIPPANSSQSFMQRSLRRRTDIEFAVLLLASTIRFRPTLFLETLPRRHREGPISLAQQTYLPWVQTGIRESKRSPYGSIFFYIKKCRSSDS